MWPLSTRVKAIFSSAVGVPKWTVRVMSVVPSLQDIRTSIGECRAQMKDKPARIQTARVLAAAVTEIDTLVVETITRHRVWNMTVDVSIA